MYPSQPRERILKLRRAALGKNIVSYRSDEGRLMWYRGWAEARDETVGTIRAARAKAYMLTHSTPVIDEGELIVGKPCYRVLTADERAELAACDEFYARLGSCERGMESHMAVDYAKLLSAGLSGVRREAESYRAALDPEDPGDLEKEAFYESCRIVLDGVRDYSLHYAQEAERQAAQCRDDTRRGELLAVARSCRRVPEQPAADFRQALQSVWFLTVCLQGLYQLGRPDRYLIDYYRRDVAAGTLTPEDAQELIDCVYIQLNENIQKGLAIGLMVGGRDAQGHDVTNELTWMCVDSIGHTRLIYPGVGLCCTGDTPPELIRLGCRLLGQGLSHPAFFNDEVITRGLRGYGLPPEEACEYIHSTCVEITPVAVSASWVASPYINLAQLLLDTLGDGTDAPATFDGLKTRLRARLAQAVRREAIDQNRQQLQRSHGSGNALVSCFVNDCLARGRDVDRGGARHNWIMPSFVGMANLADSLMTIRTLVYERREISLAALCRALRQDFRGFEELRLRIANRIPQYGNDEEAPDALVREISGWILEEVSRRRTFRGDRFIPSLFCWIMHERMGRETGATPDGRVSGFPLGDGSGPAQGREKNGPTASVLSSTKWAQERFIGGVAVNMKFSKALFSERSVDRLAALIRTFLDRGGFEMQVNVVDGEDLRRARRDPASYPDLIVRVGGYSDYFIHLSPEMQDEVIARTAHEA